MKRSQPLPSNNNITDTFGAAAAFLQTHTPLIVLSDRAGQAKVAVCPAWQGRVMTSTGGGDAGPSHGWINRKLIASGKRQPHIHVFGGEDRFWLGPEGGQFSIFFAPGAKFELRDWHTPAAIDTLPFAVIKKSRSAASFQSRFSLANYSGTQFDVQVNRQVRLLTPPAVARKLEFPTLAGLEVVAYETVNKITNAGQHPWEKSSGLLSIWILGMFIPSPTTTIVVPIRPGPTAKLGPRITSDYFGPVPADRLAVRTNVAFFRGDGKFRSKLGLTPQRSLGLLGSYNAAGQLLTLVQFTQPAGVTDYVNSRWKLQDQPFGGDVVNSYNDGPPTPGAKALGPFYELESSSPAAALAPGRSLTHVHRTIHLRGAGPALDQVARATLGVSLAKIQKGLPAY